MRYDYDQNAAGRETRIKLFQLVPGRLVPICIQPEDRQVRWGFNRDRLPYVALHKTKAMHRVSSAAEIALDQGPRGHGPEGIVLRTLAFIEDLSGLVGAEGMVLPKAYIEKVGPDGFAKAPMGTGPYMISGTPTPDKWEFVPRPGGNWLFKKSAIYNEYFPTFADFRRAVEGFFARLDDYRDKIESLITDKFHFIGKFTPQAP